MRPVAAGTRDGMGRRPVWRAQGRSPNRRTDTAGRARGRVGLALAVAGLLVLVMGMRAVPVMRADLPPPLTQDDLGRVILTADELGPGFEVVAAGPLDALFANERVLYQRAQPPAAVVAIWLVDASAGSTDEAVTSFVEGFIAAVGGVGEPAEPPVLGRNTRRTVIRAVFAGREVAGEVIVWEQSGVLALVAVLSDDGVRADDLAQRQQERLVAAFRPDPPLGR